MTTMIRMSAIAPPPMYMVDSLANFATVNDGGISTETAPTRPERQAEYGADDTDNEQDYADRMDVETIGGGGNCPSENRTSGDHEDADGDAHCSGPFRREVSS